MKEKIIVDTGFFIHGINFKDYEKVYTIPEVIKEVKDKISKIKLAALNVEIMVPKNSSVEKIRKFVLSHHLNLSDTDIKLVALAMEIDGIVITDDISIQKACRKLGIKYKGIRFTLKQ